MINQLKNFWIIETSRDGVRHRTRVELSREKEQVITATQKWMVQFNPKSKEDAHYLLEALWVHQQHNRRNGRLLKIF